MYKIGDKLTYECPFQKAIIICKIIDVRTRSCDVRFSSDNSEGNFYKNDMITIFKVPTSMEIILYE